MGILLALLLAAVAPASPPETRALWVVRTALVSPEEGQRRTLEWLAGEAL